MRSRVIFAGTSVALASVVGKGSSCRQLKEVPMKALNLLLILMVVFVTACGGGNNSNRRGGVRVATGDSGITPISGGGGVGPGGSFQAVWGGITPAGNAETIARGILSGSNSQNLLRPPVAGFAFAGDIRVQCPNGVLGGTNTQVLQGSRFRFDICDGQSQQEGCLQIGFAADSNPQASVQGSVSGASANLVMQDQYGAIRMSGTVSQNQFTGQIGYCNGRGCGTGNVFNQIGSFSVNTYGFFNCMR